MLLLSACSPSPEDVPDTPTPPAESWTVVEQGLPGALLSVWGNGSGDVWLCGADPADGKGPLVLHGSGDDLTRLETGATGDLWWVFGPREGEVWLVGVKGLILRYDRVKKSFTSVPAVTDATLFGLWGPPEGPLYTVGGHIYPAKGPGVIVRIDGDVATLVTDLPAGVDATAAFFKVWGSATDDVWVIGERGTVLHFDGATWTHAPLPGKPRLVTVHGSSKDDMAVVGGASQAVVFERHGGDWTDASPPEIPGLNGVFVTPTGDAYAVGMSGTALTRRAGSWRSLPDAPVGKDWHAVWVDERGDAWVVGGDLMTAGAMIDGAVLRYGPKHDASGGMP